MNMSGTASATPLGQFTPSGGGSVSLFTFTDGSAWFWVAPVVYPGAKVYSSLGGHSILFKNLYLANPMADVVMGFQRALYRTVSPLSHGRPVQVLAPVSVGWLAILLGAVTVGSLALLLLAWRTFFHLSGDFAEEL